MLGGLDRLFSATEEEEQVTTVAYLVIDPETGAGVSGNAGHLPALVLEAGCAPRFDQVEAGHAAGLGQPEETARVQPAPWKHGGLLFLTVW